MSAEHEARQRALGADVSECEVRLEQDRFDHFSALDRDPEKPAIGGMRDSVYPIVEPVSLRWSTAPNDRGACFAFTGARDSPGRVLINLSSQGKQAYFSADHPPRDPGLSSGLEQLACADQPKARAVAAHGLEKCAGSGALLLPQHFGAPHICHIDAKGDGFTPQFVKT